MDAVYTPAMDEYLKPFIHGVATPDKPHKDLQDSVLDVFGPLCTAYENLLAMESTVTPDGVVELDATGVRSFQDCLKHALLLTGDVVARISTNRRELVLKKINPLMVSLAHKEFSDTNRNLFGSGFEQWLKTRSETAETIGKACRAGKPLFLRGSLQGIPSTLWGPTRTQRQDLSPIQSQRDHVQQGEWKPRLISKIYKSPDLQTVPPLKKFRLDCLPKGMFSEISQVYLTQNIPQTGRLKFFTPAWEMITQDPWVLQVIQGYQIKLVTPPVQQSLPNVPKLSSTQEIVLEQQVNDLLMKEAIHPVQSPMPEAGFISSIFVVPKKDGGNRPVVNLKPLNQFLGYKHFKMEGIHMLRDLLEKGDFLVKIDLKDAYLTVPIWKDHQKYLRFLWKDTILEFACLPFGLATAPRVFTKLMKPVVGALRQRGIRLIIYLDDILIMAESQDLAFHHAASTLNLLEGLGFIVNYQKSQLLPCQEMEFLGFLIDSNAMTLQLPGEKLRKICRKCQNLLDQTTISVRELSKFLGLLTSSIQAIFPAPIHYRHLQKLKNTTLASLQTYEAQVALDQPAREKILWWRDHLQAWNGRALFQEPVELIIETDASRKGWGACCKGVRTGGP